MNFQLSICFSNQFLIVKLALQYLDGPVATDA